MAACSPLHYQREQVARTFSWDESTDSTSLCRLIDRVVHEELQNQLDISEWMNGVTVVETLSSPDSAGAQHVTERATTTFSKRRETSSSTAHTKGEKEVERTDSTSVKASSSELEKEEETHVKGRVDGWMPWYVYAVCLICAVVVGIGMALHGKKWWKSRI